MIWTSYYSNIKKVLGKNPNLVFISIAGYKPKWLEGSVIEVLEYKKLAPKKAWWQVWHDKFESDLECEESRAWYKKAYVETVLSKLEQKKVQEELLELSKRHDVCLLCYEVPSKFCHRQLVSEWLNNAGIECKEFLA